jgi:peptidoglycan/LPS O-acetylase OafA/YrhL
MMQRPAIRPGLPRRDDPCRPLGEHLDFLTGLRGLAAFYVMLSHVWYQIWPAVPEPYGYGVHPDGLTGWLTGWLYYGHFGVVVFIVLSGFCLMLPVIGNQGRMRGGVIGFLKRRAWRILPPYYCALGLCLLLIWLLIGEKTGSQWDISIPVTADGLVSHLLLFHDFTEATQINYVFWSVAVECQLYVMFPVLVGARRRFGMTAVASVFCGIVFGTILLLEASDFQDIPPQFIGLCAYFMMGMAGADLYAAMTKDATVCRRMPFAAMAVILALTVVCLCAVWGAEVAEGRFAYLDSLCALATVAGLLSMSRPGEVNPFRSVLEAPAVVGLGVFSYSLYLVHAPLIHLVWRYAVSPWLERDAYQFMALLMIAVPVSLCGARVFFQWCERPFLIRKSSYGDSYVANLAEAA